jgi:hypothetical protein
MKTITVSIGLPVALCPPVSALAKPHPDQADKRAAETVEEAFGATTWGTDDEEQEPAPQP